MTSPLTYSVQVHPLSDGAACHGQGCSFLKTNCFSASGPFHIHTHPEDPPGSLHNPTRHPVNSWSPFNVRMRLVPHGLLRWTLTSSSRPPAPSLLLLSPGPHWVLQATSRCFSHASLSSLPSRLYWLWALGVSLGSHIGGLYRDVYWRPLAVKTALEETAL